MMAYGPHELTGKLRLEFCGLTLRGRSCWSSRGVSKVCVLPYQPCLVAPVHAHQGRWWNSPTQPRRSVCRCQQRLIRSLLTVNL